ncbi:MAG: FctA domain-containing protein, partial [Pseudomonadota bacterium]
MADQTNNTPKRPNATVEDPNFIFGDATPKQKIDAWEGEGEIDLTSDAGEMSLANLHFGSTEEADFTKAGAETGGVETAGTPVDGVTIDSTVSVEVFENDPSAVIGTLTSFDPSSDSALSYSVSDARFEIVNGDLRLVEGASLDFEDAANLEVFVTGSDQDGNAFTEAFSIDVIDVNDAPSDLQLEGNIVAENDAGAVIGTLSAFDPDADTTLTYTVSDDRFEVVDGDLRLADGVSLSHEEAASIEVTVTATDNGGLETSETFTIEVSDVNEGPSDLALDGNTIAENDAGATVGTLSSFDPDAGDTVTYTVSDERFEVVDGDLRLADGVTLDHEEAASIEVTVTATDSEGLSTEEAFAIEVSDLNEGPSDLALDGNSVAENDAGATVGTLSSFDPDAGDTVTYTVSDTRFEVVDGDLRLADGVTLDHEEAASIEVTVTATDSEGLSTQEDFTIDVTDVNEGPSDLALDGNTIAENDAGATVGTLS